MRFGWVSRTANIPTRALSLPRIHYGGSTRVVVRSKQGRRTYVFHGLSGVGIAIVCVNRLTCDDISSVCLLLCVLWCVCVRIAREWRSRRVCVSDSVFCISMRSRSVTYVLISSYRTAWCALVWLVLLLLRRVETSPLAIRSIMCLGTGHSGCRFPLSGFACKHLFLFYFRPQETKFHTKCLRRVNIT